MIKVKNDVEVYEMNGVQPAIGVTQPVLVVTSHNDRDGMVVLEFPGVASKVTLSAADLIAAIVNAKNVARYRLLL